MVLKHRRWLPILIIIGSCGLAFQVQAQNPSPAEPPNIPRIDLPKALELARQNSPQFQSAALDVAMAGEDRQLARAAFVPTLNYFNQYIYTQGNGTSSGVFVSNDGVHIYNSQATVHGELYSPGRLAEYRRSVAAVALAEARREIAARGIVSTVIERYYAVVTAQRHYVNAQQSLEEARRFVETTQKLEQGGEVAHSDTVKAQLTLQQRERDRQEAQLAIDKARIGLAVMIFPDCRDDFTLVDDLDSIENLATFEQIQSQARDKSPELHAAEQAVRQEEYGVAIARSGNWPTLSFDYFFGINANQFAIHDAEGHNQLGSVAQISLNIPIFNWWTTRHKIRQADLRRQQAKLDLTLTRKQFDANLRSLHREAQTALTQLVSLKRSVDLSAESLHLTILRYEAGEVTVLEVVDAQSTLAQARNAYDDGLSRYRLALANLQTLTGKY